MCRLVGPHPDAPTSGICQTPAENSLLGVRMMAPSLRDAQALCTPTPQPLYSGRLDTSCHQHTTGASQPDDFKMPVL